MSISKSFKLRRPSSIRMQYILSSFIWELKVFIVSFNHAFQLKIPSVIIFKIAYVAIQSWTKYVLYFLTHRTLILLWPLPSLNKWIDQCCSLASVSAEIRLQHFIYWGGGWQHACSCQANSHFTGFFTGSDPVKNALFTGIEIFYSATRNIVCTDDCCNANK